MDSNYSNPTHRKVTRKKYNSVKVIPETDALLSLLIRISPQPLESLVSSIQEKIYLLRAGIAAGKYYCPDKFVKFLQIYGSKLKVENNLEKIYQEIERLSALSWLNARIFSSSLSWSHVESHVLINMRAEVVSRLYTKLSSVGTEVEGKEQELLRIIDYWLVKANEFDVKKPGLSRMNKSKFAGIKVGELNCQEGKALTEEVGEIDGEVGVEFESPRAIQVAVDGLLSELSDENEKKTSFLKREIAYNMVVLMKRLTEDRIPMTEADVVDLLGVAMFWLTLCMGLYFGKLTTILMAPFMAFVPVFYGMMEHNKSFEEIAGSIGPRIFLKNQQKVMIWIMDCVLIRIIYIGVAMVVSFMADQLKLLNDQHFVFLWDQLVYYGAMLERNCMIYYGGGKYFPKQSKVDQPTDVMMKNGIFYLNGVKYTQVEGPVRRMQIQKVHHSKSGVNRHKVPISIELLDEYENRYVDVTEMVSFRYLVKEIAWKLVQAVGGRIKPRIDPQYYAALVNRWKQWG